jgi:hypothetical protein
MSYFSDALDFAGGLLGYQSSKDINTANRDLQYAYATRGLGWKIKDAARYGIHPLAAIGASPTPMPSIPMQNPMSHLSSAFSSIADRMHDSEQGTIDKQIKTYVLAEAQRRALDSKYDYQLLIPVEHPHQPGVKWWAFNSRYQAFGAFANTVVMAANADQAMELMGNKLGDKAKTLIEEFKKTNREELDKKFKDKPIFDDIDDETVEQKPTKTNDGRNWYDLY